MEHQSCRDWWTIPKKSLFIPYLLSNIHPFSFFHMHQQGTPGKHFQIVLYPASTPTILYLEIRSLKLDRKIQGMPRWERYKYHTLWTTVQWTNRWSIGSSSWGHITHLLAEHQPLLFKWSIMKILSRTVFQIKACYQRNPSSTNP